MKFLLVGHGGCFNRGCEAIVRSTIIMLRDIWHKSEITLSSFNPEEDQSINREYNVNIIPASSNKLWERFSRDWIMRQVYNSTFNRHRTWELEYSPIIPHLKKSDVVLSIGGDNYTLDYHTLPYFLRLNKLVKRFRKKLVIWGASIGPFPQKEGMRDIIEALKMADLITVRESKTFEYLKSIGVTENIKLVADSAFILSGMNSLPIDNFFQNIHNDILGFNISPILEHYMMGAKNDMVLEQSIIFLRKVINEMKLYVLLIPHVTKRTYNNDYIFMQEIFNNLKGSRMISLIPPIYNAMHMKYIISRCRFFIGARTHSTIAALSTAVPTLSIGYSMKANGINEDIFGSQNFLIGIKDFSAKELFNKFNEILTREREIQNILLEKFPKIRELAWGNIEYLREII